MNTQPEALRLADMYDFLASQSDINLDEEKTIIVKFIKDSAAELRRLHEEVKYNAALERVLEKQCTEILRLHEVNQVLMKAIAKGLDLPFDNEIAWFEWRDSAEVALSKATGESNE